VLDEAARLPALLASLRENFPLAELIVVDGGSTDGSVAAALPLAHVVLQSAPGRARQMNLGAAGARGHWLLFLHADSEPLFDEVELRRELAVDGPRAERPSARDAVPEDPGAWGFCRVRLVGRSAALALIGRFMNGRSRLTRVATGDQGLLVERRLFEALNGFAAIPLMEDVEICKRLRRRASPRALPLTLASSGRRWDEQGAARTVLRMWLLRFAYWCGVSPQRLWRHYYGDRALRASPAD
jgi:rSAM/selenodomain-associated transferase 2